MHDHGGRVSACDVWLGDGPWWWESERSTVATVASGLLSASPCKRAPMRACTVMGWRADASVGRWETRADRLVAFKSSRAN